MHILVNTFLTFAQTYGSGAYNSSTYGSATAAAGADGAGGANGLANTGFAIALVVTAACLLIFTALVVRFWRRKKTA